MNPTDKIVDLDAYKASAEREQAAQNRRDAPPKRRRRSVRKGARVCGVVLLVAVCLFLGANLPLFRIDTITVTGINSLTEEKVLALSGIQPGDNLFFAHTGKAKEALRLNPFVEDVTIRRSLPSTLIIEIRERKSVGYVVTANGYAQVGEGGRLLAMQQSLSDYKLPVISGIDITEVPTIGGFIQNEKLAQALEILESCDQSLLDNIAELNVGMDHYILAYTNQQLEVRLGGLDRIEERLQDLNGILTNVVGVKIPSDQILYIDMRYEGSPVIKLRA